jgi:hypothetical protein
MTHIANASLYPTKKAFKLAVSEGKDPYLEDPSIFGNNLSGRLQDIMQQTGMITVTNHPKRSWFACVKNINGAIKVE